MRLDWADLGTSRAEAVDGRPVEIVGWPMTALPADEAGYFLLTPEPMCCQGCLPGNPLACVEVYASAAVALHNGALRLRGRWRVLTDDPMGWRYQLVDAQPVDAIPAGAPPVGGLKRRNMLMAGALLCAATPAPAFAQAPARPSTAGKPAIDMHSHAGSILFVNKDNGNAPFTPVADPMRQGGMAVICLAVVTDSPTSRIEQGRIRPFRTPKPGELYAHAQRAFARLHSLVQAQGLGIIKDSAGLRAATSTSPSVIVSSEGGDFLEGQIDRIDEARERWSLRHLQLTHYRPNELGDIQTEPAVNNGLTPIGVEAIRRCNRLGVVVDVAHGTYELVKKAAAATTKPLILSHTSLTERPVAWTRRITPDHARAIASTNGVIGIWPPAAYFHDIAALADGIAHMADIVGPLHVGLGTDMMGLVGPSTFDSYALLPWLSDALRRRFNADETANILGGNYQRVFEASLG
jgi:membrane dipeptidase